MVRRWIALVSLSLLVCAGADPPRPVKLEVDLVTRFVRVGEQARLSVRLVDADNHPAAAPKDLPISIVARLASQETQNLASAVLRIGRSSVEVDLPPAKSEGLLYIWAKQPELRYGGTYLRVRPKTPVAKREEVKVQPSPWPPTATIGRIPTGSGRGMGVPDSYRLALRFSPQRSFLANGKDPVTVHAFVTASRDAPLPGFRVQLFDTSGTLQPAPLTIPPGAEEGMATLTSNFPGEVKVEYLGASPGAEIEGDKIVKINFEPPIVGFEVKPSPQRVSLLDTCDLVVRLVDEKGTPIATRTRRVISLALATGRGELSAKEIPIEPDGAIGRASFTPVWWGPATLTASTPNLLNVQTTVEVDPPLGLLAISITGGLVGGYVFLLKRRRSKHWRIPLGALTGVILFWAVLFLGLNALPRAAVLNPISVFVISVLGGWLGTGVFEPVLKRLGLETS